MGKQLLVLTTYSDEAQIHEQKKSIKSQLSIDIDHIVIDGLNKVDSQKKFHSVAYSLKDKYEFILKLDADMVPVDNFSIKKIIDMAVDKNTDRLTLPVFDFYTNSLIMGLHTIKSSKIPKIHNISENNTDGWIGDIKGQRLFYEKEVFINHAFVPSDEQSIRFGLHRGLKSRTDPNNGQWISLMLLFKNWNKNRDTQIGYAVLAALYGLGQDKNLKNIDWNYLNHNEKHFNKLSCQIKNDFSKKRLSDINLLKKISFARIHFRVFRKVKPIIFLYLRYLFNYHILSRKNFVKKEK